ncbi:hypothetical protein EU527_16040 [Candidatus Thorarchaeota archaeon]|nr:MAG: hypothetical protein EU527_16040 [Candidatus Thorarchaeota archaeon]
MSLLKKKIGTLLLLTLFLVSSFMAMSPITNTMEPDNLARSIDNTHSTAASMMNISIPYVDKHYGSSDGIIDPTEYANSYTDPVTGVTSYFEHDGTMLYLGLEAFTTGWIGIAWQNYTSDFRSAGLNNSDVIVGYVPGQTHTSIWRVQPTDAVSVHYILSLRNGTVIQESDYPDILSEEPVEDLNALPMYKDMIIGMRIGEVRHFVIPAAEGYNEIGHPSGLYGEDLEYEIKLTRIYRSGIERVINPADDSDIIYSDEYGTSTFQHKADTNQSRIIEANGSDNGTVTQIEYTLYLNSTDNHDIALLENTQLTYPFVFMFGNTEELNGLPTQHTSWTEPAWFQIIPNSPPSLSAISPTEDSVIDWILDIKLNATDDYVRRASYRIDDLEWNNLQYNFLTDLWEESLDLSSYDEGLHVFTFNASDPSNATSILEISFEIDRPFLPLLGMKIDVTRNLILTASYGSRIEEDYTITNNGSVPISSLEVYMPEEYESNFLSISAKDGNSDAFQVTRLTNVDGFMHWRIHLSKQVGFQETYTFELTTYMHSLFWLTDAFEFQYRLSFLKYPVLPYIINKATFTLSFPDTASGVIPNEELPDATAINLEPFTQTPFVSNIRLYTENILVTRSTKIVVDAWGWLSYEETISLENSGSKTIQSLQYIVPAYATAIKIYDEVGILAMSQRTTSGAYNETNTLSIQLSSDRFGDSGFKQKFKYTFKISYVVQASAYQESSAGGIKLDIPIGKMGDNLILKHTIDIVFPVSVTAVDTTDEYRTLYGIFDTTYRYTLYNRTERNQVALSIVYQTTIGAAARPMLLALIVGLIALFYVSYRKVELPEEVFGPKFEDEYEASQARQAGAPPGLLREFANLYSRKTTLNMDLEKLEAGRRKGKVKKREYMMREKDLKTQIEDVDSKLPAVKEELVRYGTKYRDLVAQLELQEEKIEGAKAGLRQLLQRKKKQRISRVAFEKSRQDYLKTIQKATSATDRVLLSIQEEAGDI